MSKEILIPTAWEDVTLNEFIKLSELDIESFDSNIEYYIKMLGIFGNDNLDDILEFVKLTDITNIVNQMAFMNTPPKNLNKKRLLLRVKCLSLLKI